MAAGEAGSQRRQGEVPGQREAGMAGSARQTEHPQGHCHPPSRARSQGSKGVEKRGSQDREQERREVKAIASRKASGGMVAGLSFQRIPCSSVRGGGESESPPIGRREPQKWSELGALGDPVG